AARIITVHSGTRWRKVQQAIDPAGLSVKIMQTYNTFTVGGALSVNAHGRYIGQGPVVRSVRALTLVLADGRVVRASPTEHPELFYGAIGGYGALGVIADATLDLASDVRVQRVDTTLAVADYLAYFRRRIQPDSNVIFIIRTSIRRPTSPPTPSPTSAPTCPSPSPSGCSPPTRRRGATASPIA